MKAYRFFSEPGRIVTDGETGRPMLKFDEKGEYITLDPILANRMKTHFKNEEIELIEKDPESTLPFEPVKEPTKEPAKMFKCKKCDYETENKGELMAHYRTAHKEE